MDLTVRSSICICIHEDYISTSVNATQLQSHSLLAKMVLEAGYPSTTGFRKVVKATILVRKKPGMSDADFIEHYNHKHAQMAAPVLQKHNVITYSLVGPVNYLCIACNPKSRLVVLLYRRHIASNATGRS